MGFEFGTAARIVFGAGTLAEAGQAVRSLGARALVVTGADSSRATRLLHILQQAGVTPHIYAVTGEPEVETVVEGAAFGRAEGCEHVIAMGGGAAIDAGKAIAAMMTNDGSLLDYLEVIGLAKPLVTPPAPFTAIPTTAGTGAEVTRNAVIASAKHGVKVSLRSPSLMARVVIVDPELTYGLSPHLTAVTGMDALTQLLEAFVCTRANPLTDGFCREGLQRAGRSLRRVFAAGGDRAGRKDMALASLLSGMALANAGLGAVHGIAAPLGGMLAAPHGAVCAALLPRVVEANVRALRERAPDSPSLARYKEAAALLGAPPDDLAGWLQTLVDDFGLPRLGAFGVGEQHLDELARKAARASSMRANPIELSEQELRRLVRAAL